jgi:hypothetical protein
MEAEINREGNMTKEIKINKMNKEQKKDVDGRKQREY